MVNKVIELRDIYDNVLLPYAHAAVRDGDNNIITSTYATIQTVNTKQDIITGAASSITSSDLDPSKVVVSNISGKITTAPITSTELGYLSGATENIPTAINTIKDMLLPEDASAGDVLIINDDKTALVPGGSIYRPALLTYQPSDHLLNDIQWLRADTFSWQSGDVYKTAYNHLVEDMATATQKELYLNHNVLLTGDARVTIEGTLAGFYTTTAFAQAAVIKPTTSLEIVMKVKMPPSYDTSQSIIETNVEYHGVIIRPTSTTNITIWLSSNGTGWNIMNAKTHTCNIPVNSMQYIKLTWDGNTYTFWISADGENYTDLGSTASTEAIYWNDGLMNIGGCTWEDRDFYQGEVYLRDCYVKVDDEIVWKGANIFTYYEAADHHMITTPDQESNVQYLYTTGEAFYYILDTENVRFKLPRKKDHGRIVKTYANGPLWYRLYNDGWVEQGGNFGAAFSSWTDKLTTFLVPFRDTNYWVNAISGYNANTDSPCVNTKTTTTFMCRPYNSTGNANWIASGYSSVSVFDKTPTQYLYFYVGEFAQSAIQETAGITVEVLNDKLDADLGNCKYLKFDAVIDWQEPTASNNYTWYRLYKSGWVEQGGRKYAAGSAQNITVNLPIQMADVNYSITTGTATGGSPSNGYAYWLGTFYSPTAVSFILKLDNTNYLSYVSWEVKGFAAR